MRSIDVPTFSHRTVGAFSTMTWDFRRRPFKSELPIHSVTCAGTPHCSQEIGPAATVSYCTKNEVTPVQALRMLAEGRTSVAVGLAVLALTFGVFGLRQVRRIWRHVEALRTSTQTPVTETFDFRDHEPPPFESPQFVCTMCN